MDSGDGDQYYDFGAVEFVTVVYDTASSMFGTASSSPLDNPWPGYPSGYSMTHIAVSAVVVTTIMLVIVVVSLAVKRCLAASY